MADAKTGVMPDLQSLTKGLTYTSETDAPLEPVHWARSGTGGGDGSSAATKEDVLRLAGLPPASRVTVESVRAFFQPVAEEAEWQNEEERTTARRFQDLVKALEGLAGAKAYKIGKNPMDVYVVGNTPEGDIAGVKTRVVET